MITIKFSDINSKEIESAIHKLNSCEKFPVKTAYRVGRICDKVESSMKYARAIYRDLWFKHVQLDEKGVPVVKNGDPVFKSSEDKEAYTQSFDALLSKDIEIKSLKIDVSELEYANLTPAELISLACFVNNDLGDDDEKESNQKSN